jgi:capsular exopolysaccharide synthesis family protein
MSTEIDRPLPTAAALPQAPGRTSYGGGDAQGDPSMAGRRLLETLIRHKWMMLVVVVVGTALGAGASRLMKPAYTAQALVWVESNRRNSSGPGPIQSQELVSSQSWVQLLRSYEVLDHAVKETRMYLGIQQRGDTPLFAEFDVRNDLRPGIYRLHIDAAGQKYRLMEEHRGLVEQGAVGDSVGRAVGFLWNPPASDLRAGHTVTFIVNQPRDISRDMQEQLVTVMDRAESFLTVSLTHGDPVAAATFVNALVERYVDVAARLKRDKLDRLTKILEEQLAIAEERLRSSEIGLEGFRVSTITLPTEGGTPVTPGLESTQAPVLNNYFSMQMDLESLRRDREAIERAVTGAESIAVEALEMVPSVKQSSELSQSMTLATEKRAALRELRGRYTDDHPDVQKALQELAVLERRTIPQLAGQLVAQLQSRESTMESMVTSASNELRQIPPRMIEEARMRRQVDMATTLHTQLRQQYESARLAAVSSIPDISILDEARIPERPSRDDRQRVLLMAAFGSLGLAIGLAIVRDRFDPRLRFPEQVTHKLGLPILGVVPRLKLGRSRSLSSEESEQMVEALRTIRLNVLHAAGPTVPLMATVTSTGIAEGKSFITSNLGMAFAELGYRTLVIDGDVRRGTLHSLMRCPRKPGLTDLLAGDVDREAAIQPTRVPMLSLIPSGSRVSDGPELLAGPAMRKLVGSLRDAYDVILVDSAPLGAAIDPLMLGTLTGNLLFVLRNDVTDRQLAEAKLTGVDRLPIRLLGAILNDVPLVGSYAYYSYLPGYGTSNEDPKRLGRRVFQRDGERDNT